MPDRSIMIRLGAVASGLRQGLKDAGTAAKQTATDIEQSGAKAEKAIQKQAKSTSLLERAGANVGAAWGRTKIQVNALTDEVAANREEFDRLGTTATIAGGLMVAGVGLAVKRFADFDQAMSDVAATGSDAKNSLSALRAEAIQLGADTQYSAQEAAQGIENLEKAGVSAKDILAGGLSGTLNLAAAGQLEVADAAEIAATALTQFGLSGNQMGHVADLIAAGAGKAQGEVSDLANALKYVGPVAAGMGISIEETTGALAAFASQGILSDQAGTSLRGVLAALTSPSKQAAAEIENLGISLYDSNGKFKGLTNLAGQLSKAYAGMSDQAKDASLGILFGNQQVTAARVLFDQGAEGIQSWTDKVNDAGYAARAAATKMDNLKGDVEKLSGSIDTALIQSGSGLNDMLRNMTQAATGTVNAIGSIPGPILEAGTRLTAFAGAGLLVTGMAIKGVTAFSDYRESLKKISAEAPRTAKALGSLKTAAGALGIALAAIEIGSMFGAAYQANIDKTRAGVEELTGSLLFMASHAGGASVLNDQFKQLGIGVDDVASAFAKMRTEEGKAGVGAADMVDPLYAIQSFLSVFGVKTPLETLTDQFGKLDDAITAMKPDAASAAFKQIADDALSSGTTVDELISAFPEYKATLASIAAKFGVTTLTAEDYAKWMGGEVPAAITGAAKSNQGLADGLTDVQAKYVGATNAAQDYIDTLFEEANAALKLSGSQIGFESAIDDVTAAIKKNGKARRLDNGELDLNTKKGQDNQTQLNNLATSTQNYVQTLMEQGATGKEVAAVMERARKKYIENAVAAGMTATAAARMADEMGLIPNVDAIISTSIDRKGMDEWKAYKPGDKYPKIHPKLTQSKFTVTLDTVWRINGGPKFGLADGGLLQRFATGGLASIGSQQPQIAANRGPAGIQWAETGSGPWEGFVSGHPAKKGRSRAITSEIARRLDGDVVWKNADGNLLQNAMRMPATPTAPVAGRAGSTASAPSAESIGAAVAAHLNGLPIKLSGVSVIGDYVEGRIMLGVEGA